MISTVSIGGFPVTIWALPATIIALAAFVYMVFSLRRHGWTAPQAVLCCLISAAVSLLLGRILFFAVRTEFFMDPMGDFVGVSPLFDPSVGSASVIGILAGLLLGSLAAAACMKKDPVAVWDSFAVPGLLMFSAFRFIEPLSGQGFGPFLADPAFCFVPLAIRSGWGGWMLSVCFIEGLLLLAACAVTYFLKLRARGSKTLCALILLSVLQIIPESLRCDDVLKIFVFARVTQLGYCLAMVVSAITGWRRAARPGTGRNTIAREAVILAAGILLLVAGEFALDKMEWPDWAVYLGMGVVLTGLLVMLLRRLVRNDRRKA